MVKPEICSYCSSNNLIHVPNNKVFNPDLDIDEEMDSYVCADCKTIHVDNGNISFFQRELESNKRIQTTDSNITAN